MDVAEGLGGTRDYSTMYVMDNDGKQVAQFKSNKIKPYEFADLVDAVGRWYNKAHLTVEKASGGHSVIERLRYEKKYMNMTKFKTYDEFKRTIWQVGFDTNNKTKSIAVNDMREWFDKGLMANVFADENKKWLNSGFKQRFAMFKKILGMQGISVDDDVDVIYNVSMPVASTEMVANLKALQEMGAISRETIMEKTEYVSDVEVEKKRLASENELAKLDKDVANVSKDKEENKDNPQ